MPSLSASLSAAVLAFAALKTPADSEHPRTARASKPPANLRTVGDNRGPASRRPWALLAMRNGASEPTPAPTLVDKPLQIVVGLGPSAPGTTDELTTLDRLAKGLANSREPQARVRQHAAASGDGLHLCRTVEGLDLVVQLAYRADGRSIGARHADEALVLRTWDCRSRKALADRSAEAAGESGLLATLWQEAEVLHQGSKARRSPGKTARAGRLKPKGRVILIAGGAALLLGAAVALILVGTLRQDREQVILTAQPR